MIIYKKRMNLLTAMPAELERALYINCRYTSSSMSIDKSLRFFASYLQLCAPADVMVNPETFLS